MSTQHIFANGDIIQGPGGRYKISRVVGDRTFLCVALHDGRRVLLHERSIRIVTPIETAETARDTADVEQDDTTDEVVQTNDDSDDEETEEDEDDDEEEEE